MNLGELQWAPVFHSSRKQRKQNDCPVWLWGSRWQQRALVGKQQPSEDYERDFYSISLSWVFVMLTLYSPLVVDERWGYGLQKGGCLAFLLLASLYCKVRGRFLGENYDSAALWQACVRKRTGKMGSTLLGSEFSRVSFEHWACGTVFSYAARFPV